MVSPRTFGFFGFPAVLGPFFGMKFMFLDFLNFLQFQAFFFQSLTRTRVFLE